MLKEGAMRAMSRRDAKALSDKEVLTYLESVAQTCVLKPASSVVFKRAEKESRILFDEALTRMKR